MQPVHNSPRFNMYKYKEKLVILQSIVESGHHRIPVSGVKDHVTAVLVKTRCESGSLRLTGFYVVVLFQLNLFIKSHYYCTRAMGKVAVGSASWSILTQ